MRGCKLMVSLNSCSEKANRRRPSANLAPSNSLLFAFVVPMCVFWGGVNRWKYDNESRNPGRAGDDGVFVCPRPARKWTHTPPNRGGR